MRFEPGQTREVTLVPYRGTRMVYGFRGAVNGSARLMARIPRAAYADMFGPTTGDRVRLADTDLIVEVERDLTTYGEEVKFGGGKVIRDGMGQSQASQAEGAVDTVITNALIIDHWGIVKADVAITNGRITKIGKAGNPDVQPDVDIIIGPGTEIIAGEGKILTAGGIDSHIHFICPQQVEDAIASGMTTLIGGGTGPATGTAATTCTPGPWHLARMLQAAEGLPVNLAFAGKGNASRPAGAGGNDPRRCVLPEAARGLGHHARRDRLRAVGGGSVRRAGDDPHRHAERSPASSRTPSPRSRAAPSTRSTPRAPAAATRPTSSRSPALANVLPSSTNPTRPYTANTLDEHLDMLMVCHHLDSIDPGGRGVRRKPYPQGDDRGRGHPARSRRAFDDVVGQPGDGPRRRGDHPHLADRAQDEDSSAGALPGDGERNDNARVKRYIAKYTINPAIAQGMAHEIGSIEAGKLADLVLWSPAFFGVKPDLVIKGGIDRLRADGRSQRLDPDAAAGALPADVRRVRPRAGGTLPDVRFGRGAGCRHRRRH